jgi:hypothetical protein
MGTRHRAAPAAVAGTVACGIALAAAPTASADTEVEIRGATVPGGHGPLIVASMVSCDANSGARHFAVHADDIRTPQAHGLAFSKGTLDCDGAPHNQTTEVKSEHVPFAADDPTEVSIILLDAQSHALPHDVSSGTVTPD